MLSTLQRGVATSEDPATDTRRFYDTYAAAYSRSTFSLPQVPWLRRFIQAMPAGARVLDLGCGAGRDLLAMQRADLLPLGADLSFSMAQLARGNAGSPTVCADARGLPFADNAFQGVWASASLLHLERDELPVALGEMSRVLEIGGLAYLSMKVGVGEAIGPDGRRFTYVEPEELAPLIESAAFKISDVQIDASSPRRRPAWISYLAVRA